MPMPITSWENCMPFRGKQPAPAPSGGGRSMRTRRTLRRGHGFQSDFLYTEELCLAVFHLTWVLI